MDEYISCTFFRTRFIVILVRFAGKYGKTTNFQLVGSEVVHVKFKALD